MKIVKELGYHHLWGKHLHLNGWWTSSLPLSTAAQSDLVWRHAATARICPYVLLLRQECTQWVSGCVAQSQDAQTCNDWCRFQSQVTNTHIESRHACKVSCASTHVEDTCEAHLFKHLCCILLCLLEFPFFLPFYLSFIWTELPVIEYHATLQPLVQTVTENMAPLKHSQKKTNECCSSLISPQSQSLMVCALIGSLSLILGTFSLLWI